MENDFNVLMGGGGGGEGIWLLKIFVLKKRAKQEQKVYTRK